MKTILLIVSLWLGGALATFLTAADESGNRKEGKRKAHSESSFQTEDRNTDGKLSKEEFAAAQSKRIDKRFKKMDKDGDGFVSKEEFSSPSRRRK